MNYMSPATLYAPSVGVLRRTSSASAGTRKRSLTTGAMADPAARLSFAARKSESDKDLLGAALVPVGVVFMEQVTLDLSVTKDRADVRYVLSVHHLKSNTKWKFARSFDEYRRFQHRLLKTLNHGHFCSAECPWLYTFLKSYFPKKHFFHFSTTRVVAARKDALQRFFVALQSFLLNRANHNCSIVGSAVVNEVVDFVYGDFAKHYQLKTVGDAAASMDNQIQRSSFCCPRKSIECIAVPEDDDTSTSSVSSSCTPVLYCQLCESSLEGAAYASSAMSRSMDATAWSASSASTPLTENDVSCEQPEDNALSTSAPAVCSALSMASASTNQLTASGGGGRRGTHYVTTLGCGHQFHDECIVPKLNETLRCPTCDHLEVK